ncbi:MAG TPA: PepSY domain-containing protein [Steroidobacteraceae bacterium]|nr:PepSY domain-containing protein [Steroidobacteraceae bacterium]
MPVLRSCLLVGMLLGLPVTVTVALAAAEPPAGAAPALTPTAPTAALVRPGRALTLEQAVHMAEQRFKARVVRAESDRSGEHPVYVLRMLNDRGKVWTIRVDATSGSLL